MTEVTGVMGWGRNQEPAVAAPPPRLSARTPNPSAHLGSQAPAPECAFEHAAACVFARMGTPEGDTGQAGDAGGAGQEGAAGGHHGPRAHRKLGSFVLLYKSCL